MTWEVVRQAGVVVDGERFILQHTARRKGQGMRSFFLPLTQK